MGFAARAFFLPKISKLAGEGAKPKSAGRYGVLRCLPWCRTEDPKRSALVLYSVVALENVLRGFR